MSATGQTVEPTDPVHLLTTTTSPGQTAGADVLMSALFNCGYAHRVRAGGSGTIVIKRANDTAFVAYPVNQGDYIDGRILSVGGTASGTSSGMYWIAEV